MRFQTAKRQGYRRPAHARASRTIHDTYRVLAVPEKIALQHDPSENFRHSASLRRPTLKMYFCAVSRSSIPSL